MDSIFSTRMWSQPATARQIAALKANGNHDGKYYSKGRAGQAIGESVRASGSAAPAPKPPSGRSRAGRGQPPAPQPASGPVAAGPRDPAPLPAQIVPASTAQVSTTAHASQPGEQCYDTAEFVPLLDELEQRHLSAFPAQHSSEWGAQLRDEIEAWADLRIKLARNLVGAHAELVEILGGVPAGALVDPAAAAAELLAAASPHGHEEQHLRSFLSQHSSHWGTQLRDEIKQWVKLRIRLATANAHELVDMLTKQAQLVPSAQPAALPAAPGQESKSPGRRERGARPKARRPRGTTPRPVNGTAYLATVVTINRHGAVVSLDSGEHGWLHIRRLRVLNGGAFVESVSDVLGLGQELRVRGIGTTDRGQVRLELVEPETAMKDASDPASTPTGSADDATPPAAEARRGIRR